MAPPTRKIITRRVKTGRSEKELDKSAPSDNEDDEGARAKPTTSQSPSGIVAAVKNAAKIEYPPNCHPLRADLTTSEMSRRFRALCEELPNVENGVRQTVEKYGPLARHLLDPAYVEHQSKNVKAMCACCLGEMFRLSAPESPFADHAHLKTALIFMIRQLRGLDTPDDPQFKYHYYILEVSDFTFSG
jgi:hypothetical protein